MSKPLVHEQGGGKRGGLVVGTVVTDVGCHRWVWKWRVEALGDWTWCAHWGYTRDVEGVRQLGKYLGICARGQEAAGRGMG